MEIAFIRTFSWLQPVCALYGVLVLVLARSLRRSHAAQRAA